ncbi:RraA family protein [Haloprofundus halobius]|uniref:RraA family protein n=1 Tax=Haloprofundus halobius TaxID=2876194 RepID=UPI001CCCE2D9|nr:dimethylmenaquinone methyltransferase [Haloprofundus halobius]
MPEIVTDVPRPDADLMDRLSAYSPSDLGHRRHFGFPGPEISYQETAGRTTVVGSALTVRIPPEDSTMVHKATELVEPGDVMVVDMKGHTAHAPWGEMTTLAAQQNGAVAAVVDGSVTDTHAIANDGFPVYARDTSVKTTRLHGRGGDINVPVQVGGATVEPGDVVFGNEDGVLFVPREDLETAIQQLEAEVDAEAGERDRFEEGASLATVTGAAALVEEMEPMVRHHD